MRVLFFLFSPTVVVYRSRVNSNLQNTKEPIMETLPNRSKQLTGESDSGVDATSP